MGDPAAAEEGPRRRKTQAGRSRKYDVRSEGPPNMDAGVSEEDLPEYNNAAFTWEVKANDSTYHQLVKERGFLCWRQKKYKTNAICTAKYNVFSFLPLNLYEQFHRTSNLYFLLVIILQGIPQISTLPWFTLFAPLMCLLTIRATRDLVDDIGRHRSDKAINNRPCQILRGRSFLWKKWKNVCVGDVVRLSKDSIVPADLLLLASTEPSSLCYVETADIDGETNLKFRQALTVTHQELTNTRKMASFHGTVICEEPNSRMHHFVGCLEWNHRKYPLDIGNLLLRGCRIRNTDTCYGLVIYTGLDTKIMKNCGKVHLKKTKLDLLMNKLVVLIFLFLVVMSLVLTLAFSFLAKEFGSSHHYTAALHGSSQALEIFFIFCGFLILLSVMVPMAMFIIAEFIYLGNSFFINWDLDMYYEPLDMPAKARSTSLNDQLGQVRYVFSDKTGTLTQNVMTFKKCCISGRVYSSEDNHEARWQGNPYTWNLFRDKKVQFYNKELEGIVRNRQDRAVQEFWRTMALCHTVMVHEENCYLVYQAASPDEEALVTAARNFGYVFLSRTQDTITLVELGEERVYRVLAIMDFNSSRKRMSVLVRNPEGSICLYTKGADTVILERLSRRGRLEIITEDILASFAQQTLRTLCLAYKEVPEEAYLLWEPQHQEASLLLQNRAQALHQVYNKMEQNLELLGVTAIEDKLQDGVPETIKCLKKGDIKLWVLTGDKSETAVNIGFACQLLSESMLILEEKDINRILETYWDSNNNLRASKMGLQQNMALVINGDFLDQLLLSLRKEPGALVRNAVVDEAPLEPGQSKTHFLGIRRISLMWQNLVSSKTRTASSVSRVEESPEVQRERAFVDLASRCQAVICCRVTPKQKALVVALVKKYHQVVTLAIGDGANDVNMIKTADIGVGLMGQEGTQAVLSSDYALAQFCYLRRLLLVHGRWSYMRVCKFLRYFFYKTVASMMVQIWFSFYSGFTGQPLYEGWFLALFNLLYSTLPVLYIGLFEQDVSAERSMETPELYTAGQKGELFNYRIFAEAVLHGMATSLINFFMTLVVTVDTGEPLMASDYQSFAVLIALSSLMSITVEVIVIIKYWTLLCLIAILLSLGAYIVMATLTQSFWLYKLSPKTFPFLYVDRNVLMQPFSLLVIVLNVLLSTLPVLALRSVRKTLRKLHPKEAPVAPKEEVVAEPPMIHLRRGIPTRRSSYAFSHREGYADLITQGIILRKPPGEHLNEGAVAADSPDPSDAEPPSSHKERHPSKLSWRRQEPHGKGSVEEVHSVAASSFITVDRPSRFLLDTHPSGTTRPPQPNNRQQVTVQPSSSTDQTFYSLSNHAMDSHPVPSDKSFLSWVPFWKDWPVFRKAEPEVPERDLQPSRPENTRPPLAQSQVPSAAGPQGPSSGSVQSMEVEPWPAERQPSSMEWLPTSSPDQGLPPSPGPSAPLRSQSVNYRPPLSDKGARPSPFSNKPGSI